MKKSDAHTRSGLSWLWDSRNSVTGLAPDLTTLASTVLSWDADMWKVVEGYFQAEESRLAFRGARILLQMHTEGTSVTASEKSANAAKQELRNGESVTSWCCTLRAVDLALAAAAQSPFRNVLRDCRTKVRRSTRRSTVDSASTLNLRRSRCGCLLRDKVVYFKTSFDGNATPMMQALLAHYRGSALTPSSARLLGASAAYALTAGMVVSTSLKGYLSTVDPQIATPPPLTKTARSTIFSRPTQRIDLGRNTRRFGVAWIREVRDLSYVRIQPTKSILDDAACGLWVFMRLVQSQGQLGRRAGVPHPCRLREALQNLYMEWTAACGYSFLPMRRLIGGSACGLNTVRLLVYSKPRRRRSGGRASARIFDWDFVIALAASSSRTGTVDSFTVARAACQEILARKVI